MRKGPLCPESLSYQKKRGRVTFGVTMIQNIKDLIA